MKTGAKLAIGAAVLFLGSKMLAKSKTTNTNTPAITTDVLPASKYEGKWVVAQNGNHFIVLNGKRWYTGSIEAIQDFQKAYPGNDTPISGVSEQELEMYPIAGSIQQGLNLVPAGSLNAPNYQIPVCVRENGDGSTTTYSQQGGTRPCPYGGRLVVPQKANLGNPFFLGV